MARAGEGRKQQFDLESPPFCFLIRSLTDKVPNSSELVREQFSLVLSVDECALNHFQRSAFSSQSPAFA